MNLQDNTKDIQVHNKMKGTTIEYFDIAPLFIYMPLCVIQTV